MSEYFIARQPIFDRQRTLVAYELLFRNSSVNAAPAEMDMDAATAQILCTSADIGLDDLVGSRQAFINLPERFLEDPDLLPLPPEQLVLEVLETVQLNPARIAGLETFRQRGYTLALDDVVDCSAYEAVLPLMHIVKLDIPKLSEEQRASEIGRLKERGCLVLAEKVETEDDYLQLQLSRYF